MEYRLQLKKILLSALYSSTVSPNRLNHLTMLSHYANKMIAEGERMPCYKVCELLRAVAAVELATSIEEADSVVDVISVEEADSVVDVISVEETDSVVNAISVEKADSDVDAISLEGRASNDDDDDATSDEETSSDEKLVELSDCESREIAAAVVLIDS